MAKIIIGEKYGSFRVLSGSYGTWKVQCELCGDIKNRTSTTLKGTDAASPRKCWCEIGKTKWKLGDVVRGMVIIGGPNYRNAWLLKCRCGKNIRRKPHSRIDDCGCGMTKF